jgi:RNA polymerase sigma-70 factor (ECF subfamily)
MRGEELADIIAGCKQNDSKAQKVLYGLYAQKAKKICTRYINNPADIEEVADDGLLKVFKGIYHFDETKSFEPWFRQVITRTVFDYLRMDSSKLKTITLLPDCPHFKKPMAISRAYYNDLIHLIEKLPPTYKTIFTLYHIEGYDHDDIAGKLHITPATSRSNLFKARKKLLSWIHKKPGVSSPE